jgi:shikimate kinase
MIKQNIILVGFMGTGKTSVANALASRTAMPLLDMDTRIERKVGKTITRIFAEDGEPVFRQHEHNLAEELSAPSGSIISTGGGIVLNPDNIAWLSKGGLVVCLQASVDEILRRVENDTTRPLLQTGDRRAKVEALLAKRAPLYAAIPFQIQTDGRSIEEISAEIITAYNALQ